MEGTRHPGDPRSNVAKFAGYDPDKYALDKVSLTVLTDESLTPGRAPCLTQKTVGKFLQPLTRELVELPPRPTIDELPDLVKDRMTLKDKAFWVDKPGANAYALHDAYYSYGMTTEIVKPSSKQAWRSTVSGNLPVEDYVGTVEHSYQEVKDETKIAAVQIAHQDVFPRSYQYDLDCVRYRRLHACDGLKQTAGANKKPVSAICRDCRNLRVPGLTPFQQAWVTDPGQKRWKYYPDLTATLSPQQIRELMTGVGRPFQNEACNWYYKNYPPVKYDCIVRKFSK